MANGEPTCDPVWMKLILCSRESAAVSLASKEMGEFLTTEQQKEAIAMMEKYEYQMKKFLKQFTAGYETYDPHNP